jgi:hypothetical protein
MERPYSIFSLRGVPALRRLWFFALALASGGFAGDADAASAAIPVQFASGTSSATVSGKVSEHGAVTYSIVAEAGQTMAIHLDSGYAAPMEVSVPGVFDLKPNSIGSTQLWTGTILKTGAVNIVIRGGGPLPSKPVDPSQFNLTITIIGGAAARVDRLEQVDFANGTIALHAGSAEQLKDGNLAPADVKPSLEEKDFHVWAHPAIFGNIDGYSGELAEVSVDSMYGGTGQFRTVDLFALDDGIPVFVAILPGGDRADGGFGKVSFEGGHLVVDVWGESDSGACCPTFVDPVRYRFVAGKLVSDGKGSRRKFQSSEEH